VKRLIDAHYPLTGAADHGVSEAVYLNDPDRNGVELYWDKPKGDWPYDEKGGIKMMTEQLDLENLLELVNQ
jgi:catechol 2,3-dioxygenase